jgi:hypothetical protein
MRSFFLIIINVLLSAFAFGQHHMAMQMNKEAAAKRLPFTPKLVTGKFIIYTLAILP